MDDNLEKKETNRGRSLRQKAVSVTGGLLVGAAGILGAGQTVAPIHAAGENTPKPASTPTRTSTPDVLDIQIAKAIATGTAAAGQLDKLEKLAELNTAATVTAKKTDVLLGTPPPPIVTPTFTPDQIRIKQQAGLLPTYTPVPRPTFAPTPAVGSENKGNEGGVPWGWGILGGLAVGVFAFRKKVGAKIAEGVRGIRNRSGRTPPPIGTGRP